MKLPRRDHAEVTPTPLPLKGIVIENVVHLLLPLYKKGHTNDLSTKNIHLLVKILLIPIIKRANNFR